MADNIILQLLKIDLQISTCAADSYLISLIHTARSAIETEGITIDSTDDADNALVEMYAAYLYRQRHGNDTGMPRHLRYMLNNRLLSEKAR